MYRMSSGLGHGDMAIAHQYAHSLYFESCAMVLTLVTVGKYLEARSKSHTSDALDKLVSLTPKTASVLRNGMEVKIPSEQVASGDIVVIRPGKVFQLTVLSPKGTALWISPPSQGRVSR